MSTVDLIFSEGNHPPTGNERGLFYADTSENPAKVYVLAGRPVELEEFKKTLLLRQDLDKFTDELGKSNPSLKVPRKL